MGWNLEVIRHLQLGREFGAPVDLRVVVSKVLEFVRKTLLLKKAMCDHTCY